LQAIRTRVGVRRDYESLYSLGVALAAFAAAEAFHSSGFLAAFAAGLTIAALDVELCDCFREYGETTAEMLLLFTFVLLGTSLMWMGLSNITGALILFIVLALLARPLALLLALWRTNTDSEAKRAIVLYGPRGLSSLLLILVPVFATTPGTVQLFHVASVVVLVSIVVNGGSMISWSSAKGSASTVAGTPTLMTVPELKALIDAGEPVWLLDVRTEKSFLSSEEMIKGSVRIHPQHARRDAVQQGIPKEEWAALFCT
jgi:NhaP-type Na+/H+ or K+/H+ antiporter